MAGEGRMRMCCCWLTHCFLLLAWRDGSGGVLADQPVGSWELLLQNAGVSAMHMVVTHFDTVIVFDSNSFGPSNLSLAGGGWAHSAEYNVANNSVRPLTLLSDSWCSSGALAADGKVVSTGGAGDGGRKLRWFTPCATGDCDWNEDPPNTTMLQQPRWYATDQLLPDGRLLVLGGRGQFNYEFIPAANSQTMALPFLNQTFSSVMAENNLYPFIHLSSDGNLFIFANMDSILFDYTTGTVLKTFPRIPGFESRNYPSSGSSVLLPLSHIDSFHAVEIMVCGGAPEGATAAAMSGTFLPASQNCGRLRITDPFPSWSMEAMPTPRLLSDMLLLPSGDVLLINGFQFGSAGWGLGRSPSLSPFLYHPKYPLYSRFETLASTAIPRMYHSTAALLADGRILVGGSNPNSMYTFKDVMFPTELRLEVFSPSYLNPAYDPVRPSIVSISSTTIFYASTFRVVFTATVPLASFREIELAIYCPPFTTHAFSMNQRLLLLSAGMAYAGDLGYQVDVKAPPSANVAPAGFYIFFLLRNSIPSRGTWIQLGDHF